MASVGGIAFHLAKIQKHNNAGVSAQFDDAIMFLLLPHLFCHKIDTAAAAAFVNPGHVSAMERVLLG